MVKIGIDFGKTIADLMSEKIEIEFSIEAINKLVNRFGNNNIWIVSKAGDEMEKKIKKWLLANKFNTRTGFINSQIIFVRSHVEKRKIVDKYKIEYFIDDSFKNLREIYSAKSLHKFFWLNGSITSLKDIPKNYRNKIIITYSWKRIYGFLSLDKNIK